MLTFHPACKLHTIIALLLVFTLSACASMQTEDPYTGEVKTSQTTKGAGVGAIGGAIVGALVSKDKGKGALIGAGIGGLTGAGIGNYMDRQEAELRRDLRNSGVQVSRQGNRIDLIMPGNITFRTGSSNISASFYPVLNSVATVINKFNKTHVVISGHTDNTGSKQRNQTLSLERAESVQSYLHSQAVSPARMQVIGYADQYPIANNQTDYGRAQNRRVEISLEPIG